MSTVYVVDDDEAVRKSLKWLLESIGLTVHLFASGREFLDSHKLELPGCLLLDVRMPYMGGFELQEILFAQGSLLPIIFLTAHGDIPMTVRAMKKGAFDFLEKPFNDQALIEKVQAAVVLSDQQNINKKQQEDQEALLNRLSPREQQVLDKLIEGKASKIIAKELGISYKTVEVHRTHIRDKLGVSSLAELLRIALRRGEDDTVPAAK